MQERDTDRVSAVENLAAELAQGCFRLNTSKTKILTTENLKEPTSLPIGITVREMLHEGKNKCLGQ